RGFWLADDAQVGAGQEVRQPLAVVGVALIEDDTPFVAVPNGEAWQSAGWIAVRRLDLHDVRPEVGQQHGRQRTGDAGAQVDDANILESRAQCSATPPAAALWHVVHCSLIENDRL